MKHKRKLLTNELKKLLPPLYSQEHVEDPMVWAKFYWPGPNGWTWYAIEGSKMGEDFLCFGWVVGFEKELGFFSLNELESIEAPVRVVLGDMQSLELFDIAHIDVVQTVILTIVRDDDFEPMPLSEVKKLHQESPPQRTEQIEEQTSEEQTEERETQEAAIPEEVRAKIPTLHTQDTLPDEELYAYARLTYDELGFTWFMLELDQDQDTFSGYWIEPDKEQFGYFSLAYMQEQFALIAGDNTNNDRVNADNDDTHGDNNKLAIIRYDTSFTPKLLTEAVGEERRIRRSRGEVLGLLETDSIAKHRSYYYAASYDTPSKEVYTAVRNIVYEKSEEANLSVFNLRPGSHSPKWIVVVIGDRPAEHVHKQIMEAFKEGTLTLIPYDLLIHLVKRKVEENEKGNWREHHRNIVIKLKKKQASKKNKRRGRKHH